MCVSTSPSMSDKEEKLLVSLDHEPGEVHGTDLVLRFREIGHQRWQLFGERLGVGGSLDREVNARWLWLIAFFLA